MARLKERTAKMLADAGWTTKQQVVAANPKRVRLALGRDEGRVREVLLWVTGGDPGRAYVQETVPRAWINALAPGLAELWRRLERSKKDDPEVS